MAINHITPPLLCGWFYSFEAKIKHGVKRNQLKYVFTIHPCIYLCYKFGSEVNRGEISQSPILPSFSSSFFFITLTLTVSLQAQLPTLPQVEFSPRHAWNSGKSDRRCSLSLLWMFLNSKFVSVIVQCLIINIKVYHKGCGFYYSIGTKNVISHYCHCVLLGLILKCSVGTLSIKCPSLILTFPAGVRWTISTLSEAPTKASNYANQGVQYVKDLTK